MSVSAGSKDSVLNSALVKLRYPTGPVGETAVEFAINSASFREAFAADLPADQTAVMAATQRPVAELAFTEPSGEPAWKTLPSRFIYGSADHAIAPQLLDFMAQRAGSKHTVVVEGASHAVLASHADQVAALIEEAAGAN